MSLDSHIAQLKLRHRELEAKLERALAHPSSDDGELYELKRQKLMLKDKIAELHH